VLASRRTGKERVRVISTKSQHRQQAPARLERATSFEESVLPWRLTNFPFSVLLNNTCVPAYRDLFLPHVFITPRGKNRKRDAWTVVIFKLSSQYPRESGWNKSVVSTSFLTLVK
jgi:hypothetical protein